MSQYINDKKHTIFVIVMILFVILIFAGIIFWPMGLREKVIPQTTPLYTPTITPTPTELPTTFPQVIPDYFENQNGTNGVLVGSVVLVAIILLGVLISIKNNEK